MAKHIIGLILFSLIVGVSVFVASATNTSRSVDVSKSSRLITVEKRKRKKRRRCHPHRRSLDVSAMQVAFNRDSELLSASFDPVLGKYEYGDIQLHFFAKDDHETRFLKTERISLGGEGIETSKEMPWLSRIDRDQNIYVMAEVASRRGWSFQPDFDGSRAVPLLIAEK